jgi:xanthine dehydrogenase accessory factor
MSTGRPRILVRGGGDLATGVAVRLHRTGFAVLVTERRQPLAVRRLVAFAEAVYSAEVQIEDVRGRLVQDSAGALRAWADGIVPVLVDPDAEHRTAFDLIAVVDGRMRKVPPDLGISAAPFVIGLGPGFKAGVDCHAVVETNRSHDLGRVLWQGSALPDTGVPEQVAGYDVDRVLRAPADGVFRGEISLGEKVHQGDLVAYIAEEPLKAAFDGVLRGLLHDGLAVTAGMKVGDVDPRGDPSYCYRISDKSLAVGGGVLEALLSRPEIRAALCG